MQQIKKRKTIIVCGAPASGKSTYGRKLALEVDAVLIDIDSSTEKIVMAAMELAGKDPLDRDSLSFKTQFRDPIYEQLFDIANDNLDLHTVVMIAPFTKEIQDPKWPARLSILLSSEIEVHYVRCQSNIRKMRMLRRQNPRDKGKLENWLEHIAYYNGEPLPCFDHVLIDTSEDL